MEDQKLPKVAVLKDDVTTQKYLLTHNFQARPDISPNETQEMIMSATYRKKHLKPVFPFRVATLMKNASGV